MENYWIFLLLLDVLLEATKLLFVETKPIIAATLNLQAQQMLIKPTAEFTWVYIIRQIYRWCLIFSGVYRLLPIHQYFYFIDMSLPIKSIMRICISLSLSSFSLVVIHLQCVIGSAP